MYRGVFLWRESGGGSEAGHSFPSSAKVKNDGAIPPIPHITSWHRVSLFILRDSFTFTFTFNTYKVEYKHSEFKLC
jgi:hypothetical protein